MNWLCSACVSDSRLHIQLVTLLHVIIINSRIEETSANEQIRAGYSNVWIVELHEHCDRTTHPNDIAAEFSLINNGQVRVRTTNLKPLCGPVSI